MEKPGSPFERARRYLAERLETWPFQTLLAIIVLGFGLRCWGVDFGLPHDSRPDETPILNIIIKNLLNPMMHGDLSLHPHYFGYPSLYFYLAALVYWIYFAIGKALGMFSAWDAFMQTYEFYPGGFKLILRWMSVAAGTLMIPAMYRLGKVWMLRGKQSELQAEILGLLSALLMATSYLMVRNAHFGSVDNLMTLGIILSLLFVLHFERSRVPRDLTWACVTIGLTIGVKYPAAFLLLPLWSALFKPFCTWEKIDWPGFFRAAWKPTGLVLLVFFATSPWILLDFPGFYQGFFYEAGGFFGFSLPGMTSGWLFYPTFGLYYGLGAFILLFALIGLLRRLKGRQPHEDGWEDALFLSFFAASMIMLGFNERVMTRYALPLVPVILLYAAWGLVYLAGLLERLLAKYDWNPLKRTRAVYAALTLIAVLQPLGYAWTFDRLMATPDTRSLITEWILRNVQPGQAIATGPRLGQLSLPPTYGQLVVETGPNAYIQPPRQVEMLDVSLQTRLINTYRDINTLKRMGIRYVVLYEGQPLFSNVPEDFRAVAANGGLVFAVNPLKPNTNPADVGRFDLMDAFFLPYEGFSDFERPGPVAYVYDLQAAPTSPGKSAVPGPAASGPQTP